MDWSQFNENWRWLLPLAMAELILKGFALWKAAQKGQKYWYIALLLLNTLGILPLIYLWLNRSSAVQKAK